MSLVDLINEKIMKYAIGDSYMYVEFVDNKAFKDWYKLLGPDMKRMVDHYKSSGLNTIIKNYSDTTNQYKVAQESVPGRFENEITIPAEVVKLTGHSLVNPPPHPKAWYYDSKETLKPVKVKDFTDGDKEIENQTRKTTQGKKTKKSESTLKESVGVEAYLKDLVIEESVGTDVDFTTDVESYLDLWK